MKFFCFFKPKFSNLLIGLLVLGFSFGCQKELTETETSSEDVSLSLKAAKITNLIVITSSGTLPAGFEAKLSAYGEIVRSTPQIGTIVIKPNSATAKKQILNLDGVMAVVPDNTVRWVEPEKSIVEANPLSIGTNEGLWGYLWGMKAINAEGAWDSGNTGKDATVFILDSGIDADNPDLSPNLNKGLSKSFVPGETYNVQPGKFFNHGTHVAGTIAAADNNWGVIGVAPYAKIVAVKVLSEYTGGGAFSGVNAGIVYAADNGADVINMSLGAMFNRNGNWLDENNVWQHGPAADLQFLIIAQQRAVNYAVKKGAIVIVSAGNSGINADGNGSVFVLPADLENVVAVSATSPDCWINNMTGSLDIPASYTNYGKSLVSLAAPGGDYDCDAGYPYDMVLSTGAGGPAYPFYFAAGTSMAAPHVSGVAALIIAKNGGQMDPVAVRQQLLKTADKIDGTGVTPYFGHGRVNAFRAVTE
jgi:subtilisin family serine protease